MDLAVDNGRVIIDLLFEMFAECVNLEHYLLLFTLEQILDL